MSKKLFELETELKSVSKQRPKSLILRIPASVRDTMKLEQGTEIKIEVCFNNEENIFFRCIKKD